MFKISDVEFNWNGDNVMASISGSQKLALHRAAEFLLGESGKEVPHDEGMLELSGEIVEEDGQTSVVYGRDIASDYAKRQHEEMGFKHQRGRKAKYLEDPFNREKETMQNIIADVISGVLK